MRKRGEITVFLSLCILCVSALICVMVESARVAGSRFYFQAAVNASLDNLFSQYHRKLWQQYRILGLEFESEEEISKHLQSYVDKYLEVDNWYPMELQSVDVPNWIRLTDQGGDYLAQEVVSYMLFGIWENLEIDPENGGQFFKDIKEAASAGTMSDSYDGQEKEVRKLESVVENIIICVENQEKYAADVADRLDANDAEGFRSGAEAFRREARKMDKLIEQYDDQVEKLRDKLADSQDRLVSVQQDLQENRAELFRELMNPYEAYIGEHGTRRQEILEQKMTGKRNLELLDRVEVLVEEAEWEFEESNSEEIELSLDAAGSLWRSFTHSKLNLEQGEGDKEKRGFLDQVKAMVHNGLLELVLPMDTQISSTLIPVAGFPSHALKSVSLDSPNPIERVLIHEYCGHYFAHALSEENKPIQYEMEYLLHGADSDRKNLEDTVSQLFLARQGLNLIHILSDSSKRAEARRLAITIVGVSGIAPLVEITACFIMGVWAAGEAIMDLRTLFSGGKVPLWKNQDEWQLSLEGLLAMGQSRGCPEGNGEQRGLVYDDYLKLLLFLLDNQDLQMRMLDVMEMNIQREESDFSMASCAYRVDICGRAGGKPVFLVLPMVENFVSGASDYPLEALSARAY